MRVTQEVKDKTRDRILKSARKLFGARGFDPTTTRDIAAKAGIATGTLFNYYPGKEALGMALLAQALDAAEAEFASRLLRDESIEELLFAHAMTGIRTLAPYRSFVAEVLEAAMSPFALGADGDAARVRTRHLETVDRIISLCVANRSACGLKATAQDIAVQAADCAAPPTHFVAMHLYWTLYLGALAFWTADESPNQEDTLVVLDQSIRLFVQSLGISNGFVPAATGGP